MIFTREFMSYVLPFAPGASLIAAEFQTRLAAREFCERTKCWRLRLPAVDVTSNEFALAIPDYAEIHKIERARWGRQYDLEPIQFTDLPPGWEDATEAPPTVLTQSDWNQIILYPFQPGSLDIEVFLKPKAGHDFTRSSALMQDYFNQVPDFLLEQFAEPIGAGAAARLLMLPNRPYSDMNAAAVQVARFNAACDARSSSNIRTQTRARARVRYHDF